ncbi:hypothetical protein Brms1b_000387 [Colletotrichum noveboracense]|nr:hypothetical protein Brms1b_000387 [Colletotrichum noveboracense]
MSSPEDRLAHLERLVMTFGPEKSSSQLAEAESAQAAVGTPIDDSSETGSLRTGVADHSYVSGDHWGAILDSIADLRDHFNREEQARLAESPGPASEPTQDVCANQYEAFWADPSNASIMWIGLLYSMICLALIASDTNSQGLSKEMTLYDLDIEVYRERLVQCLIMGEYTNGGSHTLETFMNYVYIEFRIHEDAEKDVWFLLGIEVNLAKRMEYHGDPKHFPGITPLEGEMRRRVWATVLLGDSLISGQMGMPRMITSDQFDTEEPRNLNDSDIEGDISELPPPRPETEHTTALGIIARRRILIALGAVSDLTSSLKPSGYAEYMRVDKILNDAKASIPPPLQPKSMASSVTDSPQTIMARLFLSHIYYKGQIMLHRRFLFAESISHDLDTFTYSRKACINAALETLRIQQVLDEETRPGGQLHIMHWRVGSLMNHHFLTATMVLCSVVHRQRMFGQDEEIMEAL